MATRSPRLDSGASSPFHAQPMRTSSFSSDVVSTRSSGAAPTVPHANPPPAYVASNEADDLLSTELARTVHVAPAALTLLNEFLDHVLYCIVCTSHSLNLGQLKAAVPVVLKPRLGKSALKVAEEELKDYIEDDEAEDFYSNKNHIQAKLAFDPDLVWKLARLRCMVYARMGNLEEEDEEEWLEKEGLLDQTTALPVTARLSMAMAPGAAIFLTSVIEYLGEQALYYAAQYAQKRHDAAHRSDNTSNTPPSQLITRNSDILLDGKDMNHVGRESPLSRLWRSWRRNTRSSPDTSSRPMSPDNALPPALPSIRSQSPDMINVRQPVSPIREQRRTSDHSVRTPSRIPPPILEHDEIRERSSPIDGESSEKETRRPSSMPTLPKKLSEDASSPSQETPDFPERSPLRPTVQRERSNSLPARQTPVAINKESPLAIQKTDHEDSRDGPTPTQETTTTSSDRPRPISSPEQANTAGNILSRVLPVVGVHHIQQHEVSKPRDVNNSNSRPASQSKSSSQPLTSASIVGPRDFDTMYIPDHRLSPEGLEAERSGVTPVPRVPAQTTDPYEEIAARQLKEHQRYSQQSHEMNTPSIYSDQEHLPRFRRDMPAAPPTTDHVSPEVKEEGKKSSLPASEAESGQAVSTAFTTREPEQVANHSTAAPETQRAISPDAISPEAGRTTTSYAPSSYAPTPEPGLIYDEHGNYIYGASSDGPNQSWPRQTDSPVSQMSGKYPAKRYHPTNEPVPELPKTVIDQQALVDATPSPRTGGHSKSSSSSSRLLGFTRDTYGRPHSIYQQSASGGMTDEVRRAHSSTPDNKRDLQETDQPTSSPKRNHLRIRADSETNVTKEPSNTYHTQRSLEHLIKSGETLHYTLTPATASLSEETLNSSSKRTGTQDLADFFRNTAPPGQEDTALPSARSRKTSMNATRAPQVLSVIRGSVPSSNGIVAEKPSKPRHKNPLGEPRDAKVDRMSGVRDLADYARSTGPSNPDQMAKPVVTGPSMLQNAERPVEMAAPNSPVDKSSRTPRPQHRLKFQARDPRPSRHAEPADLVDFIREGPPRSQDEQLSDRQAPSLGTTTASDDTNNRTSSNTKGSIETNGISSVTDSHSPLLTNSSKPVTPTASSFAQQVPPVEPNGSAQRKNRKVVKDPYAIDYDDDDDDDDDDLKDTRPVKKKNEESLIDFLRNTEPPPSNATAQPIFSATTDRQTTTPTKNDTQSRPSKQPESQTQTRARAESPHLTQAGSKLDSYRPTQATHASHVDRNRNKTKIRSGVPPTQNGNGTVQAMKAFGGGGGGEGGDTADLADYLKNTGPTPVQAGWTEPLVNKQVNGVNGESGGLRKFFSIRRK